MSIARSTSLLALVAAPFVALVGCAAPGPNRLTAEESAEGWELLFDGQSLEHWRGFKQEAAPAGWVVDDQAIHRADQGGDIVTRETYQDFELLIDWRVGIGANSGIFFRVTEDRDYVWETGPEFQILDDANHHDGGDPLTSAGSNYALHPPTTKAANTTGGYNRTHLVVRGNRVQHFLNDRLVVDYELLSPEWERLVAASKFASMPDYGRRPAGHIALQDHGDPVWFRNIKIRRL
jgi:hypothetical protein